MSALLAVLMLTATANAFPITFVFDGLRVGAPQRLEKLRERPSPEKP
jgi:hypothetical protein